MDHAHRNCGIPLGEWQHGSIAMNTYLEAFSRRLRPLARAGFAHSCSSHRGLDTKEHTKATIQAATLRCPVYMSCQQKLSTRAIAQ